MSGYACLRFHHNVGEFALDSGHLVTEYCFSNHCHVEKSDKTEKAIPMVFL